jgi:hypothetical protein
VKIGEKFAPHQNMKKVYAIYALIAALVFLLPISAATWAAFVYYPQIGWGVAVVLYVLVIAVLVFLAYWIPKFYSSISYTLTNEGVVEEKGVWWKSRHVVPYSRIMSIDVIQGPISRHFGVGSLFIYTAGYTGPYGGSFGRRSEASIIFVQNPIELRDMILSFVQRKPLFDQARLARKQT